MPTFFGKNYKKAYVDVPSSKIAPGEVNGEVSHVFEEIDLVTAAAADILKLMKLPAGARVIDAKIKHPALGGAAAMTVGWEAGALGLEAAVPAGILAATSMSSAAVRSLDIVGQHKEFAEEVQISATITGAVSVAGKITVHIAYVLV